MRSEFQQEISWIKERISEIQLQIGYKSNFADTLKQNFSNSKPIVVDSKNTNNFKKGLKEIGIPKA